MKGAPYPLPRQDLGDSVVDGTGNVWRVPYSKSPRPVALWPPIKATTPQKFHSSRTSECERFFFDSVFASNPVELLLAPREDLRVYL